MLFSFWMRASEEAEEEEEGGEDMVVRSSQELLTLFKKSDECIMPTPKGFESQT